MNYLNSYRYTTRLRANCITDDEADFYPKFVFIKFHTGIRNLTYLQVMGFVFGEDEIIARGLITLHANLETDRAKVEYIDKWTKSGEKIVILKGYNHKHLNCVAPPRGVRGSRSVDFLDLFVVTMADDEVLFDDVYELCEIIGNYVTSKGT
ncbi:hypothetical protein KM043_010904 [Ampulex compressa]|nr:hypothetical protein KM043_010904 [Ampulex compressa]